MIIHRGSVCIVSAICSLASFLFRPAQGIGEIVFAVNCGGEAHIDTNGIRYAKDFLTEGIPSDYGRSLSIARVPAQDQILYQTERYAHQSFGYNIPILAHGEYVLVLKFSEVWFAAPSQKVFDVLLNRQHIIVDQLDIFSKVGRGIAHEEIIHFKIKDGELFVQGETSRVEGNMIPVEFVKGDRDNPKINAIYVMKGTLDQVPKLPPLPTLPEGEEDEDEEEGEEDEDVVSSAKPTRSKRVAAQPKVPDPYASDDTSSMMLPIVIALGLFLPALFFLCKL